MCNWNVGGHLFCLSSVNGIHVLRMKGGVISFLFLYCCWLWLWLLLPFFFLFCFVLFGWLFGWFVGLLLLRCCCSFVPKDFLSFFFFSYFLFLSFLLLFYLLLCNWWTEWWEYKTGEDNSRQYGSTSRPDDQNSHLCSFSVHSTNPPELYVRPICSLDLMTIKH